jgi:hypothetical protein
MSNELLGHASTPATVGVVEKAPIRSRRPKRTPIEGPGTAKHHAQPHNSAVDDARSNQRRPQAAHGDRDDPDSDDGDDRLLTAAQVKRRYGNASDMWLWRRLHDLSGFPQPLFICCRRFWRLSVLIAWERQRAARSA